MPQESQRALVSMAEEEGEALVGVAGELRAQRTFSALWKMVEL